MHRIITQSDKQQLQVLKLNENIEETNKKVNELLNNAGQGFLYFNVNMLIGQEYSKEVFTIFNKDVFNLKITDLLYENESDKEFLEMTLQGILKDIPIRQEILISLLKKEFFINDKFIEVEYKVISETTFMMILTDVTQTKELNIKIKEEQQVLKMVVEIVTSLEQFMEIKNNYTSFILFINNYKSLDMLSDLRREIHTYKGLFAQKEMLNIVKNLHQFESIVDDCILNNKLNDEFKNIDYNKMNSWINEDIEILENILGNDFFLTSNYISLDRNRLGKLQAKIKLYIDEKRIQGDAVNIVLKDIEELKYNSVKTIFRPYEKLIEQLSSRLNKPVKPIELVGEDIYIGNIYKSFLNSLVHIFRNSLDHGIEEQDRRYDLQKDLEASIKCEVIQNNESICISIEDDGAGIDIEKIKMISIDKELYKKEDFSSMSEDEILRIIFSDGFSTKSIITDLSGRGVGMASVLDELNKLNGTLQIKNKFGFGVKFIFTLPSLCTENNHEKDLLTKLSNRTISYYKDTLNIKISLEFEVQAVNSFDICERSIYIPLTNDMDGIVYMGISAKHANNLISEYIDSEMSIEDTEELEYGNLSEILNITLGNILKDLILMKNGGIVGIKTPEILKNRLITKEDNSTILISKLKFQNEEIVLGYFI